MHLEEKKILSELEKLIGETIPSVEFINTFTFGLIIKNDRVSSLGLPRKGLTFLPKLIGNLSSVQDIVLFSNQLESLPESFGNLKALKFLNLVNNQLKTLPESFTELKSLQSLYLNHNKLEILPKAFHGLISLRNLNLRSNQLRTLPESFLELPELEQLFISNNPLDDGARGILEQLKQRGVVIDIIDPAEEEIFRKARQFISEQKKNS